MALNAAYDGLPTFPRLLEGGDLGGAGGSDGGDGSGESDLGRFLGAFTLFPAVYNDGGTVVSVAYVQQVFDPVLLAAFTAAGYASEGGFRANVNGAEVNGVTFMVATAPTGAPPIGTAEYVTTMTKNGNTNVAHWLVRIGP